MTWALPPRLRLNGSERNDFREFAFGLSTGTLRAKSLSCGDYLLGPMRSVRYACKYLLFPSVGGLSRIVFAIFGTFGSQLMPPSVREKWPTAYDLAAKTTAHRHDACP